MESDAEALAVTDANIYFIQVMAYSYVGAIPGAIVCGLVLIAYGVVATFPKARPFFDRVSFRLLIYSLVADVLYSITFITTPASPGPRCAFGAFANNLTISLATFFTTCIAINLQLVLVHGVNGKRMEKFYVMGTIILSLALTVSTLSLNQFGWNGAVCWYKNPDSGSRLRWIIATQSFWMALALTIETVCSIVVLVWLFRVQRNIDSLKKNAYQPTFLESAGAKSDTNPRFFNHSLRSTLISQDTRYRKVILRIALYPIVTLLINFPTVALDLCIVNGVNTQQEFRLLVLDTILCGARALVYGMLAVVDPAFTNALREIRESTSNIGNPGRVMTNLHLDVGQTSTGDTSKLADDIELHHGIISDNCSGNRATELNGETALPKPGALHGPNLDTPAFEENREKQRIFGKHL